MATSKPQPAADPVAVDSKHYQVEFENEKVRILRVRYGGREKSVMHSHPDSIAIALAPAHTRFSFPDGKTEEVTLKAGQAQWIPGGSHLPENLENSEINVVLIELKS